MDGNPHGYTLGFVRNMITEQSGKASGWFKDWELKSVYEPIFSLPHKRSIGFEAMVRATDPTGKQVPVQGLFDPKNNFSEASLLDLLCATVHVHNFFPARRARDWLFVNMHPEVFLNAEHNAAFLLELLRQYRVPRDKVVLEVPGATLEDKERVHAAVNSYRRLGYLISIDDFGVEHSNLDTVWHSAPTFVKIGRPALARAMADQTARKMLPRVVSLLHELGTLVVIQGVETEMEALIAIDADADLVTGFYFGQPQEDAADLAEPQGLFDGLWSTYKEKRGHGRIDESAARAPLQDDDLYSHYAKKLRDISPAEIGRYREERRPLLAALQRAASLLESGADLETACADFLRLEGAIRCYMLDGDGKQIGGDVFSPNPPQKEEVDFSAGEPEDAEWSRKDFFRRAIAEPGAVQVTRRYRSFNGYAHCVTISLATRHQRKLAVLCGDVDWKLHSQFQR
ncbi:MAG TPA: EAL domain-containing protein [Burkholderiales bacterium]|nr:EAL domain-containing protein [Burkholderiales bacterium]